MIDVKDIDKADVLAALFNGAMSLGMGRLHYKSEHVMDRKEAQDIIDKMVQTHKGGYYFDYLEGRVMKVEIGLDTLDERLYDRDNGPGAARRIIEGIE